MNKCLAKKITTSALLVGLPSLAFFILATSQQRIRLNIMVENISRDASINYTLTVYEARPRLFFLKRYVIFRATGEDRAPDFRANYQGDWKYVPSDITLAWNTENQSMTMSNREIALKGVVPKDFEGTIVMSVDNNEAFLSYFYNARDSEEGTRCFGEIPDLGNIPRNSILSLCQNPT